MTEEDLEDILEIEISSNPHPWTEKNFLDCIQRDYYCLIQEFNQKISGFAIQSKDITQGQKTVVCHFKNDTYAIDRVEIHEGDALDKIKMISSNNFNPIIQLEWLFWNLRHW